MNDTHVLIELIALIYLTELKEDLMIRNILLSITLKLKFFQLYILFNYIIHMILLQFILYYRLLIQNVEYFNIK